MTELHPSLSAVGAHFDEEVEKVISAHQPHQGTGSLAGPPNGLQHESKGSQLAGQRNFLPGDMDRQVEEMMHLDQ